MRSLTLAVFLLSAITIGLLATLLAGHRNQARDLRAQLDDLRAQKAELHEELSRREAAVREAEQMVASGVVELKRMQAGLDEARAADKEPLRPEPEMPRTRAVRAYLGEESLGQVWAVPRNIAKDPQTGEFTFETVVVLDEKLRRRFTVTNVVEKEVIHTATVNHNTTYIPPTPYQAPYYYPRWRYAVPHPDDDLPGPGPDPAPSIPSPPRVGGSGWGTIWAPPTRK